MRASTKRFTWWFGNWLIVALGDIASAFSGRMVISYDITTSALVLAYIAIPLFFMKDDEDYGVKKK